MQWETENMHNRRVTDAVRQRHMDANYSPPRENTANDDAVRRIPSTTLISDAVVFIKSQWSSQRLYNRRACPGEAYEPTSIEQWANILTHAVFIRPSIERMLIMMELASSSSRKSTQRNALFWVALAYGMAHVVLFLVSAAFHLLCLLGVHSNARFCFHMFDRATIYLFIAAAYLPWLQVKRLQWWAWPVRWAIWISAVMGIVYQYRFHERFKTLETICFILHGTLPGIIMVMALESQAEQEGLLQMALGCLVYAVGIIFFKLDGIVPFAHAVWHLFVVAGAFIHIDAVVRHIYFQDDDV